MAETSSIEWTDATWNPVVGCSIVSPGCTNCYAMGMAYRIERMTAALVAQGKPGAPHYDGTTKRIKGKPVWTGTLALASDAIVTAPLRWTRPRRIFVNSMGDLFHEDVPDEWIDRVFAVMALAPHHTFQVLTKRSKRMREYLDQAWDRREQIGALMAEIGGPDREGWYASESDGRRGWAGICLPLPNVWLGVSAERQQEWDQRTADLKETPAAVCFVSAEPLLGPIVGDMTGIHWVIVGGESGPDARPMHPDWARSLRDQCAAAGTAFFFKQWGSWAPGECATRAPTHTQRTADFFGDRWTFGSVTPKMSEEMHRDDEPDLYWLGKHGAGRWLDGGEHNAMPERAP